MNMQLLDARRDASGGYRVDVSRGERVGRVSSEWFSRPADQRYLSLNELASTVRDRTDRSRTRVVESALIHVEANRTDPERLALMLPGSDKPVAPTHWSFGQLASQVGAPAAYLRQLPAALAGINLQYGLTTNRAEQIKTLETDDGRVELRAVTSPDYEFSTTSWLRPCSASPAMAQVIHAGRCRGCSTGRPESTIRVSIFPRTRRLSTHRTGTSSFSWSMTCTQSKRVVSGTAHPTSISAASIAGTRRLGRKRSAWRAFISAQSARIGICGGVEDFEEIIIRHSKYASSRFAHEAAPALLNFANSSPMPFVNGIKAARERIVAHSDEDRTEFLRRRGFSKAETAKVIETVLAEEGRPPESIFDFVQGITAVARDKPHQDARLDMEAKAKKLLDRAA